MKDNNRSYFVYFKEIVAFRLGWPAAEDWTNFDYKNLSDIIKEKTGQQVSSSTLKRMFGKWDYEGGTSPYTRNTMAHFLDFKDWYHFCNFVDEYADTSESFLDWYQSQIESQNITLTGLETAKAPFLIKKKLKRPKKSLLYSLLIIGVCVASFLVYAKLMTTDTPAKGSIKSEINTGTYPWSSIFTYTIENGSKDSLYLDFDDNSSETVKISDKTTHIFLFPGYYKTRLISGKQGTLDSTYTHVLSNNWCKTLAPSGYRKYPILVRDIPSPYSQITWKKGDVDSICRVRNLPPSCKIWAGMRLFKPFDFSLDSFNFNLVVLNNEKIGGIKAYDAVITLKGEHNDIRVHLIQKGGFKWIDQEFSEVKLDGDKENLTMFEHDLSVPTEVNIINNNQNVRVLVAGKEIYRTSYKQPIGNFKGITIDFRGNGHLMSAVMNGDTL